MQFIITLALAALAVASPEPRRRIAKPPVCGGDTIASCCQTDTVYPYYEDSFNCISPGNPTTINRFRKICAATGRTAQCCETLVAGTGTECQDV